MTKNLVKLPNNYRTIIIIVMICFILIMSYMYLYGGIHVGSLSSFNAVEYNSDTQYRFKDHNRLKQLQAFVVGDPPSLDDISDCNRTHDTTRTGAFCVTRDSLHIGGNWWFSTDLGKHLCNYFNGSEVLDLGAGLGHYTRYLRDHNCVSFMLGYDGGIGVYEATYGLIQRLDLTKKHDLGVYDYVLCLEVAEHIPHKWEDILIQNIHKHNRKGVVISWALKGQHGHGHVNEQNSEYVIDRFSKLGYIYNKVATGKFRDVRDCCQWFQKSLYVFERNFSKVFDS